MATEVRWRKGTTAQHASFTGAPGEITVDTDKKVTVIHDGSTVGGFPSAKESTLAGKANSGANGDITSLTGLTTALSIAQGGTGSISAAAALVALGERTGATGALSVPSGTTAQRNTGLGVGIRYSTTLSSFEGWNGVSWGTIGGGGSIGGGTDAAMYENDLLGTTNYTVGQTALVSGATVSIATPAVVTLSNTFVAGQPVRFTTTGALPTGIDTLSAYFVIATGLTTSSFQVALTVGGAAINTSGSQSGVHSAGKIKNSGTFGPYTTADGATFTVPTGATWSIV